MDEIKTEITQTDRSKTGREAGSKTNRRTDRQRGRQTDRNRQREKGGRGYFKPPTPFIDVSY